MGRKQALIIVNPAAGRSRSGRRLIARVVAALERRGCTATVRHAGPAPGETERLARDAEAGFEVIVAAGGDGTIHAIANGIANRIAGGPRPLALLPLGTANVLAHDIQLPHDPERLATLIAEAPAQPIWPGRVGDRLFLTTASSGFDAATVAAVNPRLKRLLGRGAFAWAILRSLVRYRAHEIAVRVDGIEHRAAMVVVAKGRCYAGRYVIAPEADLAAPMLDLLLLRRPGGLAIIANLAALLLGRVSARRDIAVLRCRAVLMAGADSIPVQADGEIVAHLPVSIAVAEQQLWLLRP